MDDLGVLGWSAEDRAIFDKAMAQWPVFDMKKYLVQYITRSTLLRWEDFLVAVEASEKIKAGIAGADSASLVEYTRQLILSAESDGMTSLLGEYPGDRSWVSGRDQECAGHSFRGPAGRAHWLDGE